MKKALFLIVLIIPLSLIAQQINIITFNIRYATENDGINAWSNRVEMVNGLLKFHEPDIFGLQEALITQIEKISEGLPEFEWIGVGRDDGIQKGEFSPLFYNKNKFILVKHGTFWLSETPEKPSMGWDASYKRVVTWGKFKSKVSGKHFLVFNTHFDHRGDEARKNSAILIKEKIKEIDDNLGLPVILTGDFNLEPETEPIALIKTFLNDSWEISAVKPYGPFGTFNGFQWDAPLENRIDYIFTSKDIKVLKYAAISDSKEQRWPSDHLPVFAKIQLK